MAPCVYVLPTALFGGMHWDLHGDKPFARTFDMMLTKVHDHPMNGFQVEMRIDCPSSLVEDGHIVINEEGVVCSGAVEAEVSCMMKMVEAMRVQHRLYPADFNLIMLSEKRALFNAMKNNIDSLYDDYVEMAAHVGDCHTQLGGLCLQLSRWVGDNHPNVAYTDASSVSAFVAIVRKATDALGREIQHADRMCQYVMLRNDMPASQTMLDATVPTGMDINWGGSYNTLLIVYKHAVAKLPGNLGVIRLHRMRDGQYLAVVDMTDPAKQFEGPVGATQKAALAKLFYVVIKYVNVELGFSIMDFHADVKEYQQGFIGRFDFTNENIVKCATKLYQIFGISSTIFGECLADMASHLDVNGHTEVVLESANRVAGMFEAKKIWVAEKWTQMAPKRSTSAEIESQLLA